MKHKTRYFNLTTETGYEFFTHVIQASPCEYHDHDYVEIIAILDNPTTSIINEQTYVLQKNSIVFLRPTDKHLFCENSTSKHRDFCFTTRLFKETCDFLSDTIYNSYVTPPRPFIVTLSDNTMAEIESISQKISLNMDIKMKSLHAHIKLLLIKLLEILLKGQEESYQSAIPDWLEQFLVQLEINSNISSKSLDEILDKFHYNKVYIRRTFKKYLNVSLNKFWLDKKLTRAASMLKLSNVSVKEISQICGFESYAYFNKRFIEKYRTTPFKYKKKL